MQSVKEAHYLKKKKEVKVLISECCNAIPLGETYANMGLCNHCLENTEFYDNEEEGE